MGAIPILLIVWPALAAAVLPCIQDRRVRGGAVYGAAVGVMALASALLAAWMAGGAGRVELYVETELIDHAMLLGEPAIRYARTVEYGPATVHRIQWK